MEKKLQTIDNYIVSIDNIQRIQANKNNDKISADIYYYDTNSVIKINNVTCESFDSFLRLVEAEFDYILVEGSTQTYIKLSGIKCVERDKENNATHFYYTPEWLDFSLILPSGDPEFVYLFDKIKNR